MSRRRSRSSNPALPAELGRILSKALEKDRNLRYQTATELKTDLLRLKRDADSGGRRRPSLATRAAAPARPPSGRWRCSTSRTCRREGGRVPPRRRHRGHHHRALQDQGTQGAVAPGGAALPRQAGGDRAGGPAAQGRLRAGRQHPPRRQPPAHHRPARGRGDGLAAVVRALRPRDGGRLRGAGRDRAQDRRGAAGDSCRPRSRRRSRPSRRRTSRPTTSTCAGRSYARRLTRQDLEFALQMFENAVLARPRVRARLRGDRERLRPVPLQLRAPADWLDRSRDASRKAIGLQPHLPEVKVAQAWILYTQAQYEEAAHVAQEAVERKRDTEGAYYLMLRALFAAGRYQDVAGGGRRGARGERHRLQRLRADHERARGARQEGSPRATCGSARSRRSRTT